VLQKDFIGLLPCGIEFHLRQSKRPQYSDENVCLRYGTLDSQPSGAIQSSDPIETRWTERNSFMSDCSGLSCVWHTTRRTNQPEL